MVFLIKTLLKCNFNGLVSSKTDRSYIGTMVTRDRDDYIYMYTHCAVQKRVACKCARVVQQANGLESPLNVLNLCVK